MASFILDGPGREALSELAARGRFPFRGGFTLVELQLGKIHRSALLWRASVRGDCCGPG